MPIAKSLYEKEVKMNGFEERVATEISALENVLFWTKNLERKGFRLNGFVNHYPDFIVVMKSGKILLLETKGDDRDNSDSEKKIKLGRLWANKTGTNYRYFMVFDKQAMSGAIILEDFLKRLKELLNEKSLRFL